MIQWLLYHVTYTFKSCLTDRSISVLSDCPLKYVVASGRIECHSGFDLVDYELTLKLGVIVSSHVMPIEGYSGRPADMTFGAQKACEWQHFWWCWLLGRMTDKNFKMTTATL